MQQQQQQQQARRIGAIGAGQFAIIGVVTISGYRAGLGRSRARVQIAVATLSDNCLRQTVHTHHASVHRAAKLVAALLRVARVTASLAERNGSLPPGL